MKITVLGGSGFVGSALVDHFSGQGHCIQSLARPQFDLQNSQTFSQIEKDAEVIIHAAGIVGAGSSVEKTWLTNVKGMYDLCEHLKKSPSLRYFLYLSSGAVYGYSEQAHSIHSSTHPIGDYGMGKLLAEVIGSTSLSCKTGSARLFFPYGPGQSSDRFIPKLFQRVFAGEVIDFKGRKGEPLLNPTYIGDVVSGLGEMVTTQAVGVRNIGAEASSLRDIAELIGRLVGESPQFKVAEALPASLYCCDGVSDSCHVATSLQEGLQRVYANLKGSL